MSVVVDSSVWIDHLRGVPSRETAVLDLLLERHDPAFETEEQEYAAGSGEDDMEEIEFGED